MCFSTTIRIQTRRSHLHRTLGTVRLQGSPVIRRRSTSTMVGSIGLFSSQTHGTQNLIFSYRQRVVYSRTVSSILLSPITRITPQTTVATKLCLITPRTKSISVGKGQYTPRLPPTFVPPIGNTSTSIISRARCPLVWLGRLSSHTNSLKITRNLIHVTWVSPPHQGHPTRFVTSSYTTVINGSIRRHPMLLISRMCLGMWVSVHFHPQNSSMSTGTSTSRKTSRSTGISRFQERPRSSIHKISPSKIQSSRSRGGTRVIPSMRVS